MKQKIAIIGSGNVGSALKRGLEKVGYEVRNSQRGTARETAEWGVRASDSCCSFYGTG